MAYQTDEEQLEAVKSWWRENGRSVIAGVVIALVAVVGWQQWQAYERRTAESASLEYYAFLEQIQAEDAGEGAVARGVALIDDYSGTPYAALAALWLGQYHVEQGELDEAAARLRWAAENGETALAPVARLRLARVLAAAEDADAALAVLGQDAGPFLSQYQELRADIYAGQGARDEAVAAYREALAADELDPQRRALLELKLNDLGATVEPVS